MKNCIRKTAATLMGASFLLMGGCSLKYAKIRGPYNLYSYNIRNIEDHVVGAYYSLDINFSGLGPGETMLAFEYEKWSDGRSEQTGIKRVKMKHGSHELVLAPHAKGMTEFSIKTTDDGTDFFSYRAAGEDRMITASQGALVEIKYPKVLKSSAIRRTKKLLFKDGKLIEVN